MPKTGSLTLCNGELILFLSCETKGGMNHHDRMLAAIRGEPTDEIPWAPRMDLWYIAQRARGTLPGPLAGLNIADLAESLGVGCHSQRADYTLPRKPEDFLLRGIGLDNHPDFPFRLELRGMPVEFRHEGDSHKTVFRTAAGEIRTHLTYTDAMRRDGISLPYVEHYAIQSPDDLEAVAQIFEHIEVIPTPECYAEFHRRIGDRGLAIANGIIAASPMHLIFHELMSQEEFIYLYMDEREKLAGLAKRMEPFYEKLLDAVLACKAEGVYWGANYDDNVTWPTFFEEEIAPWLEKTAARLHAAGKFLLTHTDGENERLLPLYPRCHFDVADSVCPKPMTRCTLKQVRDGMGPKVTTWGGLCSVAFLKDSMDEAGFEAYLDRTFGDIGTGGRLVLGVSDNVPPDALLPRLERVKERIRAFGPV